MKSETVPMLLRQGDMQQLSVVVSLL